MSATSSAPADLPELLDHAYHQVEKLIWKIVHNYHRRYGGDKEELIGQAHVAFMEAVHSWDPAKGAFTTHVYTQVYYALINNARKWWKQAGFMAGKKCAPVALAAKATFRLRAFLSELSEPAQQVAQAAIDLSQDGKPAKPERVAKVLSEAGWPSATILECFRELNDALT